MKKRILTAVAVCGAVWIGVAAQRDNRHFEKGALTGIEYDYGHRKSFSGAPLHANRLQMQLALTF